MYQKEKNKIPDRNKAEEVLENDFYKALPEIKDDIQNDRIPCEYENRCVLVNVLPAKCVSFLKFFQRRQKFKDLMKKKDQGKNKVTRTISSPALEKFDGYEKIRYQLVTQEKRNLVPLDIVYEPGFDESVPVQCCLCLFNVFLVFISFLAYKTYIGQMKNGQKRIWSITIDNVTFAEIILLKTMIN